MLRKQRLVSIGALTAALLLPTAQVNAEPLEYIGKPVRGIPVSQAVKAGKRVLVSGTPAFDGNGKIAVGDFPVQMKQVMDNMTAVLKASGAGWDRVVKTNVVPRCLGWVETSSLGQSQIELSGQQVDDGL